jgi:hypothetical protein
MSQHRSWAQIAAGAIKDKVEEKQAEQQVVPTEPVDDGFQLNKGDAKRERNRQKKAEQKDVREQLDEFFTTSAWAERAGDNTYILDLKKTVNSGHQVLHAHMTINRKDVTAARGAGHRSLAVAFQALPYHVTFEAQDMAPANAPRWRSDGTWETSGPHANLEQQSAAKQVVAEAEKIMADLRTEK